MTEEHLSILDKHEPESHHHQRQQDNGTVHTTPTKSNNTLHTNNNRMMLDIPLERLRNELQRLRLTSEKLQQENKVLQDNNKRLMMASKQSQELFCGIVNHTKSLKDKNAQLELELGQAQDEIYNQKLIHQELKEGIAMKNAAYEAEVMLRTECQRVLGEVVDVVQETCRKPKIVEDVLTKTEGLTR
mmetsp:Transcript_12488/g.19318  ORF Transcript_12488/g.19318 Transcript_12488/m.19318 type:complete len:187 (-) Transcript_12488:189-749(-)|eukprot:CAMPEP_0195299544 /NCGR_PEP_ID=MMETSP0707-20130614/25737_1 /TAXON_ID=33640 /ORGANISM="Asterionellopsis glacialis, Strain CCMP134" /LENGTH=186 /DNA_ID=CAMNT_0040361977 /DNA_START=111 /DNA_END=671 /DNA_ORIENTATION=+